MQPSRARALLLLSVASLSAIVQYGTLIGVERFARGTGVPLFAFFLLPLGAVLGCWAGISLVGLQLRAAHTARATCTIGFGFGVLPIVVIGAAEATNRWERIGFLPELLLLPGRHLVDLVADSSFFGANNADASVNALTMLKVTWASGCVWATLVLFLVSASRAVSRHIRKGRG